MCRYSRNIVKWSAAVHLFRTLCSVTSLSLQVGHGNQQFLPISTRPHHHTSQGASPSTGASTPLDSRDPRELRSSDQTIAPRRSLPFSLPIPTPPSVQGVGGNTAFPYFKGSWARWSPTGSSAEELAGEIFSQLCLVSFRTGTKLVLRNAACR